MTFSTLKPVTRVCKKYGILTISSKINISVVFQIYVNFKNVVLRPDQGISLRFDVDYERRMSSPTFLCALYANNCR